LRADNLPCLLAGQTRPDNCPLLNLGRPLFYLSPAGQPSSPLPGYALSCRLAPIIIGQPEQRLELEQWEERVRNLPGHPAAGLFRNNFHDPEETDASWARIKSWLLASAASADNAALLAAEEDKTARGRPDPAVLSFFLLSRLDEINKDRQEAGRKLRQAQEMLNRSLDNDDNAGIDPELPELEPYVLSEERRLLIWARAAAEADLPAALWLMPRNSFLGWLNLWQPARAPEPALPLRWSSEARLSLSPLRAALAALLTRTESCAAPLSGAAVDFTKEVQAIDHLWPQTRPAGAAARKLYLYILPASARASLSLRPGWQTVLVWE
jgi:hypothetical protein